MRRRFSVLAFAVGAVTLAIGIGVASGAKLKTKSASAEVAVDQTGTATAECGQGQKVISGGFEQPDFDPTFDEAGFQFYGSRRDGGRKWSASAANYGGGASGTLTSYAYCRKGVGLKERSASVTIAVTPGGPEFEAGTATAKCKRGEKVVAGGHDVANFEIYDTEAVVYSSHKDGKRSWTASAVSYSNAAPTLTAYAYCRKGDGTKAKSKSTTIGSDETGTPTAKCTKGKKVVSGGFDNPDFGSNIQLEPQILAYASMKVGKRKWTASGFNNGNRSDPSGTGTFTVYAYCEKKKS
jgi:hypothetical protein